MNFSSFSVPFLVVCKPPSTQPTNPAMPFVYNKREFPDQAAKNAYLESLKPVKAWEDLGESFEPLPKADAPDAFCKVTLLYISELYSRKNWFCKGKDSILVMPDICALVERTYPDGTVKRALFDAGVRKVRSSGRRLPVVHLGAVLPRAEVVLLSRRVPTSPRPSSKRWQSGSALRLLSQLPSSWLKSM